MHTDNPGHACIYITHCVCVHMHIYTYIHAYMYIHAAKYMYVSNPLSRWSQSELSDQLQMKFLLGTMIYQII